MGSVVKHVDARSYGVRESRTALVRFADLAVMFTASWGQPAMVVRCIDGSQRRQYFVRLFVPDEQRARAFDGALSITLYATDEPMMSRDFVGVHARHHDGVTLAWFFTEEAREERRPEPTTAVVPLPSALVKRSKPA